MQANSEARKVIAEKWRGGGSDSAPGSPMSSKDLSDTEVFVELPQLADEVWVTEDELARLFLVTSEMTHVLKVGAAVLSSRATTLLVVVVSAPPGPLLQVTLEQRSPSTTLFCLLPVVRSQLLLLVLCVCIHVRLLLLLNP